MRRSRGLLIALVAAIIELIIVAATGNQWVSKRIFDQATGTRFPNVLARGSVGFPWRFNPQTDRDRIWAAQLIGIGALIVLVFLFVLVLTARASRSYFGHLIGIWGATTVAALLAAGLRQWIAFPALYPSGRDGQGFARLANAFTEGPSSTVALFALASGLLTGLIAAAVAVLTTRPVEPAVVAEPAGPPPWTPETAPPWGADPAAEPPPGRWEDQPTEAYRTEGYDRPTEAYGATPEERERAAERTRSTSDHPTEQFGAGDYERRGPLEPPPGGEGAPQPGSTSELPRVSDRERERGQQLPNETNGRS
jgi:hypothetical protein